MSFIVERILELASRKSENPDEDDFVDLGLESFDQHTDSDEYGVSYSNTSQTNKLVGLVPNGSTREPKQDSCAC